MGGGIKIAVIVHQFLVSSFYFMQHKSIMAAYVSLFDFLFVSFLCDFSLFFKPKLTLILNFILFLLFELIPFLFFLCHYLLFIKIDIYKYISFPFCCKLFFFPVRGRRRVSTALVNNKNSSLFEGGATILSVRT